MKFSNTYNSLCNVSSMSSFQILCGCCCCCCCYSGCLLFPIRVLLIVLQYNHNMPVKVHTHVYRNVRERADLTMYMFVSCCCYSCWNDCVYKWFGFMTRYHLHLYSSFIILGILLVRAGFPFSFSLIFSLYLCMYLLCISVCVLHKNILNVHSWPNRIEYTQLTYPHSSFCSLLPT